MIQLNDTREAKLLELMVPALPEASRCASLEMDDDAPIFSECIVLQRRAGWQPLNSFDMLQIVECSGCDSACESPAAEARGPECSPHFGQSCDGTDTKLLGSARSAAQRFDGISGSSEVEKH